VEGFEYSLALRFFKEIHSLKDPTKLFNSSLEGNVRRAIDIHEGDKINEAALKELIRSAVALNVKGKKTKSRLEDAMKLMCRCLSILRGPEPWALCQRIESRWCSRPEK
jgi:hypothetical protein